PPQPSRVGVQPAAPKRASPPTAGHRSPSALPEGVAPHADDTFDHARTADSRTIVDGQPAPVPAPPPLERGATLGRYLVIEKLGEGGMGVVVRAYDPKLHREVALKRLHRDALDSDGEARLLREAQAMAQLSHPNVITIHDVERSDDGVVMAMEYVEGQTLAQWIEA